MKSLKNVLAALAFVIAIGSAFATNMNKTDYSNADEVVFYKNITAPCSNEVICSPTGTGPSCDSYRPKLDEGECDSPLTGYNEQQ